MQLGVRVIVTMFVPEEPVRQYDGEAADIPEYLVQRPGPEGRVMHTLMLQVKEMDPDHAMQEHRGITHQLPFENQTRKPVHKRTATNIAR